MIRLHARKTVILSWYQLPREGQHNVNDSGFNAFGKPVSTERQVAALDCAADDLGVDPMLADPVIRNAAKYIERDEAAKALLALRNIVDLTGAYRLLAVLCST